MRYLPVILLMMLIGIITYSFFFTRASLFSMEVTEPTTVLSQCTAGEKEICKTGIACEGIRSCINGRWSGCTVKQVCIPGSLERCVELFCSVGLKTCNECGTGYGPCSNK